MIIISAKSEQRFLATRKATPPLKKQEGEMPKCHRPGGGTCLGGNILHPWQMMYLALQWVSHQQL